MTHPHNTVDTNTLQLLSQHWQLMPISQFYPPVHFSAAVTTLTTHAHQPISSPNPLLLHPISPGGSSAHPTPMSDAIFCLSASASSRYVTRCKMVGKQVALSHRTDGKSNRTHSSATRFSSKSSCSSCLLRLLVTPLSLVLLQTYDTYSKQLNKQRWHRRQEIHN